MLLSMQKRGDRTEFALSVRSQTPHALKVNIEFGHLENCAVMTDAEYVDLVDRNRERMCYLPEAIRAEPNLEPQVATVAQEIAVSSPEPESVSHRAIQEEIAAKAKKHGFAASIEYVLPNDKRIDVALFGHGLRIAVEVSVTNRQEYELSNIEKALEAGFGIVWVVAPDVPHLDQLKAYMRGNLPPSEGLKVQFFSVEDVRFWLQQYSVSENCNVCETGYEIDVAYVCLESAKERQYRLAQVESLIN